MRGILFPGAPGRRIIIDALMRRFRAKEREIFHAYVDTAIYNSIFWYSGKPMPEWERFANNTDRESITVTEANHFLFPFGWTVIDRRIISYSLDNCTPYPFVFPFPSSREEYFLEQTPSYLIVRSFIRSCFHPRLSNSRFAKFANGLIRLEQKRRVTLQLRKDIK